MPNKKFSIKHIAAQAAVSIATVDRVINNRPGVRGYTVQRVLNAIEELEEQSSAVKLTVKKLYVDVIMHTPKCYSTMVKESILQILPSIQPSNVSPRFHFFEDEDLDTIADNISHIIKNGTQGLIIKTTDDHRIRVPIDNAYDAGIPTVTFCTDIRNSKRASFIGIDHYAAGQSAAYLMGQWLRERDETILISISNYNFLNEAEREMGFRQAIRQRHPKLKMNAVSGGLGLYEQTFNEVDQYLDNGGEATAIYSVGGGNPAILAAFEKHQRPISLFIGHDLDASNRSLLKENKIHAVLEHNIERDIRHAFLHILKFHGHIKYDKPFSQSRTNIITPYNL
ncbi:MAG: LacI family DNA-binding transcriptional regulator [Arenicella sp.]